MLLPGPTDSWRSYEPVLARLPSSVRAVAVSQRGHGDSDKLITGYRVEDFAADVVPFLDVLGIDRAVLAGHSGSCPVVRRVAIDQPERVAGLVLEASPTTLNGDTQLEEFVTTVVSGLADPIPADFARSFIVDTSSEGLDPKVLDQLVDELLKVPARVWKETFARLLRYDDSHELRNIAAPALLVRGTAMRWWGTTCRSCWPSASPMRPHSFTQASDTPRGGRTRHASPPMSHRSSSDRSLGEVDGNGRTVLATGAASPGSGRQHRGCPIPC